MPQTTLEDYILELANAGAADASCGDAQEIGWYADLFQHGHSIFTDADPERETLSEEDAEALASCAGAILLIDSQGFRSVSLFEAWEALEDAWATLEEEWEADIPDWN